MSLKNLIIAGALLLITSLAAAQECYESSILSPSPFMGNNGEIFKLADGSLWEIKYEYEYLYEYYPTVIICPSLGKLVINGVTLNVEQVGARKSTPKSQSRQAPPSEVIESQMTERKRLEEERRKAEEERRRAKEEKRKAEAANRTLKYAEQGHASAQTSLGFMYDYGKGVTQDYEVAMRWYRKAADQGYTYAQIHLGVMYQLANGVMQDYVQAHMWYSLAAAQGNKRAGRFRDHLAEKMTPEQIAEAQKMAREWKPKGK